MPDALRGPPQTTMAAPLESLANSAAATNKEQCLAGSARCEPTWEGVHGWPVRNPRFISQLGVFKTRKFPQLAENFDTCGGLLSAAARRNPPLKVIHHGFEFPQEGRGSVEMGRSWRWESLGLATLGWWMI